MKVHVVYRAFEVWEISLTPLPEPECGSKYNKLSDKKWRSFCKAHHFHPTKDANGKIYDLYLKLCAEGLV